MFDKIRNLAVKQPTEVKEEKVGKRYAVATPSEDRRLFTGRRVSYTTLKQWKIIYEQGGVYTTALNAYPEFVLSEGYRFVGEDAALVAEVEDFARQSNLDTVLFESIIDALVFGDSYDEIIYNAPGTRVLGVSGRQSQLFETEYDDYNKILNYRQYDNSYTKYTTIPTDHIMHLRLFGMSGAENGLSLIGTAFDEVLRDTNISEAASTAIIRHGFPVFQVKVGTEGEMVPDEVLDALEATFKDLQSKHEIITQYDVDISMLNDGGIDSLDKISSFSMERTMAALGVPLEILGLGSRSSTYATANVTLQSFLFKIGRMQNAIEQAYNKQVIDKVTGVPGSVRLEFNGIGMENQDTGTMPKESDEEL